jgi:carboxymethylenebutenolidase
VNLGKARRRIRDGSIPRTALLRFCREDPNAAPSIRQALSKAFAGCPVDYWYEVHPGAEHGYALPDRDIHDKRAANRDWELIFVMFRRQLSA